MKSVRNNNKGFTLVELIIVIAIIAILAVVLAPQYLKYVEKSRVVTDMDSAAAIEEAINVLVADDKVTCAGTVTWDIDGEKFEVVAAATELVDGDSSSTSSTVSMGIESEDIVALLGEYPVAKSKKAVDLTFTISFASDGTPSVTVNPKYADWND